MADLERCPKCDGLILDDSDGASLQFFRPIVVGLFYPFTVDPPIESPIEPDDAQPSVRADSDFSICFCDHPLPTGFMAEIDPPVEDGR